MESLFEQRVWGQRLRRGTPSNGNGMMLRGSLYESAADAGAESNREANQKRIMSMRGIAAWPECPEASFVDVPEPEAPGPGEVLCQTLELGICGTDREILSSRRPALPYGEEYLVLGHECLGEVVEIGAGVTDFRKGDRVVPVVRRPLAGFARRPDFLAVGQFTERGIYHEHGFSQPLWLDTPEHLVAVPPTLSHLAVFSEPLAVVEKGILEAQQLQVARFGEADPLYRSPRVLVTGLGPIAFAAMLCCGRRGWQTTVYGRDPDDSTRAELARVFGARYRRDTTWVTEPDDLERDGYDLILECTGSDEVLALTSLSLASCGAAVWLGSSRQARPRHLNLAAVMRNAVIGNHLHLGSVNASLRDFHGALETLAWVHQEHAAESTRIFTSTVEPDQSLPHFHARVAQGIKTVIRMTNGSPASERH